MKRTWISSSRHDDLHEFLGSTCHVFFRRRQCIWASVEVWENSMMPEVYKRLVLESPFEKCIISKVSSVLSFPVLEAFQNYKFVSQVHPWMIFFRHKTESWVFWNWISSRLTVCEFEVKGQWDSAWVLGCPCFKSLPSIASIFSQFGFVDTKKVIKFRTHGMNEHVFFLQRTSSKASFLVFMWKFQEANKGNLLYKIFRAQGGRTMILLPRNQVQVFMFSTSRNGGIIAKTCLCTLDQVKTNDLLNLRNITHDTMNSIATGWYQLVEGSTKFNSSNCFLQRTLKYIIFICLKGE